jgi:mono/diheme cytochrome c family protein
LIVCLFVSCKKDIYKDISLDEFILEDGFKIELVAAEPLLNSPMAMTFDDKGRIWVAEMPGYMRDIEGSDENAPDGRIVILEDTDGDGQMDRRKIFLDSLVLPRTLQLAYGGLLYAETPNLYWIEIGKNDQPGKRELVDSLYVRGGNIEHQPNGLLFNIDNWIYSAKCEHRYRRVNGKWLKEPTKFRGQWGISNDDAGRLFYNSNSNPMFGDNAMPVVFNKNPYQKIQFTYQQNVAPDRRVYPYQATSVNRGYQEGVLDSATKMLRHFTSSCSPLIYRGSNFPNDFYGDAFVCGPEVNLVKRFVFDKNENGRLFARQAYERKEFLISKDESFRPINLYNGPDGSMYILDLRKGVIQHRAYMTRYLRDQIEDKGLQEITGIGRIYKVTHQDGEKDKSPRIFKNMYGELVSIKHQKKVINLLKHQNAWVRERAQRWLIDIREIMKTDDQLIVELAKDATAPLGQIHALWTLEGLQILNSDIMTQVAETTDNPDVWVHLLRLSEFVNKEDLPKFLNKASSLSHPEVQKYLCYAAGFQVQAGDSTLWLQLAQQQGNQPNFAEALISNIHGKEELLISKLPLTADTSTMFLNQTIQNIKDNSFQAPQLKTNKLLDRRNRGMELYATYCATCHGADGKGLENLAPPLYQSEYVAGDPRVMTLISLVGLEGEIEIKGKKYNFNAAMPGIKNNPDLDDTKLADILSFIRNGFGTDPSAVSIDLVAEMRAKVKDREELFTAEELMDYLKTLQ